MLEYCSDKNIFIEVFYNENTPTQSFQNVDKFLLLILSDPASSTTPPPAPLPLYDNPNDFHKLT